MMKTAFVLVAPATAIVRTSDPEYFGKKSIAGKVMGMFETAAHSPEKLRSNAKLAGRLLVDKAQATMKLRDDDPTEHFWYDPIVDWWDIFTNQVEDFVDELQVYADNSTDQLQQHMQQYQDELDKKSGQNHQNCIEI